MNPYIMDAFMDELEKISGVPRYVQQAGKAGKQLGSYAEGLLANQRRGRRIAKTVAEMGKENLQGHIYRANAGNLFSGGPPSATGDIINAQLRRGKAIKGRLIGRKLGDKELLGVGKAYPQGTPRGDAMRGGKRGLRIGLDEDSLIAGGYYRP